MDVTQLTYEQRERFALIKRQWEKGGQTLDDANLEVHCPLDNGRHPSPDPAAVTRSSLGTLDHLPLELIEAILVDLHLLALTNFRQANRRAMYVVDTMPPYAAVAKHAPNILRAAICIKAGDFTLQHCYDTLVSWRCATCNEFGSYLYLITCKRVCWYCFMHHKSFLPMRTSHAMAMTKLPMAELLERVPHVFTLPGSYKSRKQGDKTQMRLLDRPSVLAVLGPLQDVNVRVAESRDLRTYDPRRYKAVISAPYLDSAAGTADWGGYCASDSCRDRRRYTKRGFLTHVAEFGEIRMVNGQYVHVEEEAVT